MRRRLVAARLAFDDADPAIGLQHRLPDFVHPGAAGLVHRLLQLVVADVVPAQHEGGCTGVHEVRQAVLETDGRISIVKRRPGGDQPPPHANKIA